MEKDIVLMKCSEIIQFIEETTGEEKLTQIELTPVPFADEDVYITGFRVDTPIPQFHLKVMRKLNLFGTNSSSQQQIEYYMMNPDSEMWIDSDALDGYALSNAITELKKKLFKSTVLHVMHVSYSTMGEEVERHIAYDSRRIACKEGMTMRKKYNALRFHFTEATNKETKKISDLEFATAAL